MKTNLYYKDYYRRVEAAGENVMFVYLKIASYPRLLLEVFIRKNFGERYFSFGKSLRMALVLAIIPFFHFQLVGLYYKIKGWFSIEDQFTSLHAQATLYEAFEKISVPFFFITYSTWYIFLAAFLVMAFKRRQEIKRNPSVFDFKKFSLYGGDFNPRFFSFKIGGKQPNVRTVETLIEPTFFLVIGIVLLVLDQWVGLLLTLSSLMYSFSYVIAYRMGDHFVMDKIDQMISNEELMNSFVENKPARQTRGFRVFGSRPKDKETRERVAEKFFVDEEAFEVS
jgi:hypothetical protein